MLPSPDSEFAGLKSSLVEDLYSQLQSTQLGLRLVARTSEHCCLPIWIGRKYTSSPNSVRQQDPNNYSENEAGGLNV